MTRRTGLNKLAAPDGGPPGWHLVARGTSMTIKRRKDRVTIGTLAALGHAGQKGRSRTSQFKDPRRRHG